MKKRYIFITLLISILIILGVTNPTKQKYYSWATNQVMKREVKPRLEKFKEKNSGTFFEKFSAIGEKFSMKYIQPNIKKSISQSTKFHNYLLFSVYTTDITILEKDYHFIFLGICNHFIPLSLPN